MVSSVDLCKVFDECYDFEEEGLCYDNGQWSANGHKISLKAVKRPVIRERYKKQKKALTDEVLREAQRIVALRGDVTRFLSEYQAL